MSKQEQEIEKIDCKARFIWHGVSAHIRSGYGNLARNIPTRLVARGFQIYVSAYYGVEPGGLIIINGVPHLPSKLGQFGEISCLSHIKSLKINAGILCSDWWAFPWFPAKVPYSILHSPFDHIDYNSNLQRLIKQYDKQITFCNFAYEELKKYGVNSVTIPHGVNTNIFCPINQGVAREATKIPKDKFVVLILEANSDKEDRKGRTQMYPAIRHFLDQNPDAEKDFIVIEHTNPKDPRGLDLVALRNYCNLHKIIKFENPLLSEINLRDEEVALLFNSADVLLAASRREGFGMPILESESCGTPVIGTDFSSMTELIKGHGWLAKVALKLITPIMAKTAVPDVYSIADCIEQAYNGGKTLIKYGKKCRKFALDYEWDKLIEEKWIPFLLSVEDEMKPKSLEERKLI